MKPTLSFSLHLCLGFSRQISRHVCMYVLHSSRPQRNTRVLDSSGKKQRDGNGLSLKRSQTMHVPHVCFPQQPLMSSSLGHRRAQSKPVSTLHLSVLCPKNKREQESKGCWCDGKATLMGREMGTTLQLWPKDNDVIHVACIRPLAAQPLQYHSQTRGEQERSCLLSVFWIKAEGKLGRNKLAPCKLGSCNTSKDSQHVGATGSSQCLSVPGRRPSRQRQALSTE